MAINLKCYACKHPIQLRQQHLPQLRQQLSLFRLNQLAPISFEESISSTCFVHIDFKIQMVSFAISGFQVPWKDLVMNQLSKSSFLVKR